MHLFHIPQCTIQNRYVHISVLNGVLWDMEQVHCGMCDISKLADISGCRIGWSVYSSSALDYVHATMHNELMCLVGIPTIVRDHFQSLA